MSSPNTSPETAPATQSIRQHAGNIREELTEMGGQVRDAAREKFDHVKQQVAEGYRQGRQHAKQWEQRLEEYVQQEPLKSVLIAAAAGLLLGILLRRK